jgi:hypothetical protein
LTHSATRGSRRHSGNLGAAECVALFQCLQGLQLLLLTAADGETSRRQLRVALRGANVGVTDVNTLRDPLSHNGGHCKVRKALARPTDTTLPGAKTAIRKGASSTHQRCYSVLRGSTTPHDDRKAGRTSNVPLSMTGTTSSAFANLSIRIIAWSDEAAAQRITVTG